MILPDTSIWIEFLKKNDPYNQDMSLLLTNRSIVTIEPIFAELLYGVRSKRDKTIIKTYWNTLPKVDFKSNSLIAAAGYANDNNYHNLGIGLIDTTILIPVLNNGHKFWTLDKGILAFIDSSQLFNPE